MTNGRVEVITSVSAAALELGGEAAAGGGIAGAGTGVWRSREKRAFIE